MLLPVSFNFLVLVTLARCNSFPICSWRHLLIGTAPPFLEHCCSHNRRPIAFDILERRCSCCCRIYPHTSSTMHLKRETTTFSPAARTQQSSSIIAEFAKPVGRIARLSFVSSSQRIALRQTTYLSFPPCFVHSKIHKTFCPCGSTTQPSYFSPPSPSPCAAAPFNTANLSLFLLPMIRSVFFFSISAILSQFAIRLMVPSTLTTMGPRWSSETVVPPVLMSSWVAFAGAGGRARGVLGASLLLDVSGCCCSFCSAGAEEFEVWVVEDIVNVRSVLTIGCLVKVVGGA